MSELFGDVSLLGDEHLALEHLTGLNNVACGSGKDLCTVSTPGCLEELHQELQDHLELWETECGKLHDLCCPRVFLYHKGHARSGLSHTLQTFFFTF